MSDPKIRCPHCQKSMSLSEVLTKDHRQQYEAEAAAKAKAEAKAEAQIEILDMKTQLRELKQRAEESAKAELEARAKARAAEAKEKNAELEIERRLDKERKLIEEAASNRAAEQHRMKDAEKDHRLEQMKKQVDEMQRKLEQGSQQVQGEVLELELEAALKEQFPLDEIEPVGKGVRGGDIIQGIRPAGGKAVGKIIWEAKRTKTWSDKWIDKIKDDQREAGAEHAVIVTQVLPRDCTTATNINGVWVVDFETFPILAEALRQGTLAVAQVRAASTGKGDKMEFLYNYLTGTGFVQRIQAIVETFSRMREDIHSEETALQKNFAKRKKQLELVITNTAYLYGDLQGIVGRSLPEIKHLELPAGDA